MSDRRPHVRIAKLVLRIVNRIHEAKGRWTDHADLEQQKVWVKIARRARADLTSLEARTKQVPNEDSRGWLRMAIRHAGTSLVCMAGNDRDGYDTSRQFALEAIEAAKGGTHGTTDR